MRVPAGINTDTIGYRPGNHKPPLSPSHATTYLNFYHCLYPARLRRAQRMRWCQRLTLSAWPMRCVECGELPWSWARWSPSRTRMCFHLRSKPLWNVWGRVRENYLRSLSEMFRLFSDVQISRILIFDNYNLLYSIHTISGHTLPSNLSKCHVLSILIQLELKSLYTFHSSRKSTMIFMHNRVILHPLPNDALDMGTCQWWWSMCLF